MALSETQLNKIVSGLSTVLQFTTFTDIDDNFDVRDSTGKVVGNLKDEAFVVQHLFNGDKNSKDDADAFIDEINTDVIKTILSDFVTVSGWRLTSRANGDIFEGYDFTDNTYNIIDLFTKQREYGNVFWGKLKFLSDYSDILLGTNDFDSVKSNWIDYGNSFSGEWQKIWNEKGDFGTTAGNVGKSALLVITGAFNGIGLVANSVTSMIHEYGDDVMSTLEAKLSQGLGQQGIDAFQTLADNINSWNDSLGKNSVFMSAISKGIGIFTQSMVNYKNGVDETSFGRLMESSWTKGGNAFVNLLGQSSGFSFNDTTPLDAGENLTSIYGHMMLGVPPIFIPTTDPKNRVITNTFLRDARFLTLYPGFAQYSGSNMLLANSKDQYHQTTTPKAMIEYLKKNGYDASSYEKDRRYYKFKSDFDEYYSYLETMLNTIWVKMGLGNDPANRNKINLFTFFDNPGETGAKLKPQYNQGIGFYVSDPRVPEMFSSTATSFGSDYSAQVAGASETYNRINYISGMGTGGAIRNASRIAANTSGLLINTRNMISEIASNTIGALTSKSGIASKIIAVGKDVQHYATEVDLGAMMQTYAVTNGMKIVYPELWSDSTYAKQLTFDVEFISPYGDPLSIFQYVMVPFCALATFAMPRQAADNGYVAPFFVRADIPGLFTCDFGLITDFNFTRGGSNNLWTKDGLPRAISCSFSIQDLYPYLAMTKRISFLSANPNYTCWLDSLCGLHATSAADNEDSLNEHWTTMLNRVSGSSNTSIKNKFNKNANRAHSIYANSFNDSRLPSSNNSKPSWLRNL